MLLWREHRGEHPDGCQYSAYEQVDDRRGLLFELLEHSGDAGWIAAVALSLRGAPNYDAQDGTRVLYSHTEHEDQFV